MDDLGNVQLDQLTAEMAWIRRLARALVKDASVADDIAQDTWLAAAGNVPGDRPLRPWLSRVVLNLVRMRSRGEHRRDAREANAPVPTPTPTANELIDRVEVQRIVAGEVLALAEPYRSTVLLHYFEGLSSADIARRLDVPDGTVRRRLKRALDELRGRLSQRDARKDWLALLVPLATPGSSTTFTAVGGMTMKKLLAVALLIVIAGSLWLWKRHDAGAVDTAETATAPGQQLASPHGASPSAAPQAAPWFVQAGAPGKRVAGRVVYHGEPFAGATVRLGNVTSVLAEQRGGPRVGDELASVTSRADGTFDFGVLPAATFIVSAEALGKTPASLPVATADRNIKADALVLELGSCRSQLHGTIVDASGGGVARARLRVVGLGGADADATGKYALCVPPGDSVVRVEADGYGALALPIHLVGELRKDFELVPESVLAGIVVDETKRPIANARVLALPQAIERNHFLGDGSAIADADGRFRITGLAPGQFQLAAAADGFGTSAPRPAVASTESGGRDIMLVVARRARVSGRVVMNGSAVAGARVAVEGDQLLAQAVYSQADGSFTLDGVPLGKPRVTAGTYEVVTPKQLVVDKAIVDGVVLEVSELAALRGRVLRHGAPIADALVQTSLGTTARSDTNGAYELPGLPAGDVQVTAQVFGSTNAFAPWTVVKLTAGRPTSHDIELTGGAEVHGTVVDESGAVVPNVYVRLIDGRGDIGESMTDAAGAFECTSMLGGGEYRVAVFPTPGSRVAFKLAANERGVVDLKDGDTTITGVKIAIVHERLSISGRVVDDRGTPVADAHVEAVGGAFGTNAMLPSIRADANGQFTIGDLARGAYTLHAHAGDGSDGDALDVSAGATGIELHLIRPGGIEGKLVGFSTMPRVHARQLTTDRALGNEAIVDGDHFSITGLRPGKYVLEALGGSENAGKNVDVQAGVTLTANLESRGRGTVDGTLVEFTTKAPIPGMVCAAAQSLGGTAGDLTQIVPDSTNTTDARGTFHIPAPLGKARVMCFSNDGTFSAAGADAEIAASGPARIELVAVRVVPPPCDPGYRIKPLTLPLVIVAVDPQGPAAASGLAAGDRVISIDGAPVAGLLPSGAMTLSWNHRPGSTITLGVERNGAPMTFKVVAGKPAN